MAVVRAATRMVAVLRAVMIAFPGCFNSSLGTIDYQGCGTYHIVGRCTEGVGVSNMCFSLLWLRDILIWAVCIGAAISIAKLLIPVAFAQFPLLGQIINIIIYAFVLCAVIYIAFMLISCLIGSGGLSFPVPHRGG